MCVICFYNTIILFYCIPLVYENNIYIYIYIYIKPHLVCRLFMRGSNVDNASVRIIRLNINCGQLYAGLLS